MGRDGGAGESLRGLGSFNPRARVGRDSTGAQVQIDYHGFNPRARVGRDVPCWEPPVADCGVSIHAPAWGATDADEVDRHFVGGFNPRARVGRDWRFEASRKGLPSFNPRARVGRDRRRR